MRQKKKKKSERPRTELSIVWGGRGSSDKWYKNHFLLYRLIDAGLGRC